MFNSFLKAAVFPFAPASGRALDFGCGHGPVLAGILTEAGYEADLFDKYFSPGGPGRRILLNTTSLPPPRSLSI